MDAIYLYDESDICQGNKGGASTPLNVLPDAICILIRTNHVFRVSVETGIWSNLFIVGNYGFKKFKNSFV